MPQDSDLTTGERVRAVHRIRANGELDDTRLDILVSAASDAVRDYTERDFLFLTAPEGFDADEETEKTFSYDGSGFVSFGRFEAREIVSVTVDGELLDDDEWRAGPTEKTKVDTYTYLYDVEATLGSGESTVDVVVVAKWGIVDLPSVVELATMDAVKAWWTNPEGLRTREFEGVTVDDDGGLGYERAALPQRARLLLEPYRR
jgi:hypothetical protein